MPRGGNQLSTSLSSFLIGGVEISLAVVSNRGKRLFRLFYDPKTAVLSHLLPSVKGSFDKLVDKS